jgi:hypothetical protein
VDNLENRPIRKMVGMLIEQDGFDWPEKKEHLFFNTNLAKC